MSDSDEEAEEDWRIGKLYAIADKSTPEEFASLVEEVGTTDAIVMGGMCSDAPSARAHFVVMSLIDLDDATLPECLQARHKHLKAAVEGGGSGAGIALIAALEGLLCSEGDTHDAAKEDFDEALKVLWEHEVVDEESIRAWQADERTARYLKVPPADAQMLHERGRIFVEWLDEGEGE